MKKIIAMLSVALMAFGSSLSANYASGYQNSNCCSVCNYDPCCCESCPCPCEPCPCPCEPCAPECGTCCGVSICTLGIAAAVVAGIVALALTSDDPRTTHTHQ